MAQPPAPYPTAPQSPPPVTVKRPSSAKIAGIVIGGVAALCVLCLGIGGVMGLVDNSGQATDSRPKAAALGAERTSAPATTAPVTTAAASTTPAKPTAPKTTAPRTTKASPKPKASPTTKKTTAPANCNPNYSPCVPNDPVDVDCAGGSGNGPSYVQGPVRVIGDDVYDLDRDGDGIACD
ncbi:hypothetical protein GCM10009682_36590 [Luedemannella flava]|uniref:Excalibur calcium-binding domain-containing protein n=1 Tax=Luedemannella flava TaxID=349316 RepID=A0ABN2M6K8_9ACTN